MGKFNVTLCWPISKSESNILTYSLGLSLRCQVNIQFVDIVHTCKFNRLNEKKKIDFILKGVNIDNI